MNMSTSTEQMFLKIFKFVVMLLMGLSLLGSVIALVAGLWFLSATPKAPEPERAAPRKEVNIDEFLQQLDKSREEPKEEEKKTEPAPLPEKPEVPKYMAEARKIVACLNESNKKAALNLAPFSEEAIEDFRRDLQRVADASNRDRGQPYVTDAVRVVCAILLHDKVIALRTRNKELRVFIPAVNFHIQAWDAIQAEARQFEAAERRRVEAEEHAEQARVEAANSMGWKVLAGAGAAFGLFMAIALYLIIAAMESHLRLMSQTLQRMGMVSAVNPSAPDSAGST